MPSAARATSRSRSCTRLDRVAQLAAIGGAERQLLDGVEAIANRLERHERPQQPRAQQAAADRRHRAIQFVEQRTVTVAFRALDDFEMLERGRIDQQGVGALPIGDRADVREVDFLRAAEVMHERAGRGDGGRMALESEAVEAAGAKLSRAACGGPTRRRTSTRRWR